ncbi:sugar ABC transporter ATP-binding protein [Bradyrhizobium manausense]|uniref:Sugar ABC transporter n=1 Tax=Bradyrhizobium manausense TaxID=989370 RepID=A0A0R3D2L7_9BRAD|nr:sugar ABC transporter ATP-binding protein [Bradyrhizobium manausense]KRQ01055.1 sugar ABC transporter [Bradyrhizobium manausense]
MNTGSHTPLLAMRGIVKSFGGAQALRGVDFDLESGEIHALLGENGAGKSTLMNVLSGVIAPDQGEIRVDGAAVRFTDPRAAQAAGVATIFQELDLVPSLDVTANLFLGRELTRAGVLDGGAMRRAARARLDEIGFDVDVDQPVGELSVGRRQIVAIAKALTYASRILVMDEPTAALTAAEVQRLFHVMREIARRGVGIVYISHRLEEVPRVADRVTILRDGRIAGTAPPTAPQSDLVALLVGRPLAELYPRRSGAFDRRVLHLERAAYRPRRPKAGWRAPREVSLEVRAGEVVGLAGIMGAGRTELLSALYGAGGPGAWSGRVEVGERPARLTSIPEARRAGVAFVSDDRRGAGLMLRDSVERNLVASVLRRVSPFFLMSQVRQARLARQAIKAFDVRPPRPELAVGALSGGNQQKVALAKEVLGEPRLLLLDEPTRGVDVGAKGEIYARIRELAAEGVGILVASSEMPELIGLCDRIVVLRGGRTVAEFPAGAAEDDILAVAESSQEDSDE